MQQFNRAHLILCITLIVDDRHKNRTKTAPKPHQELTTFHFHVWCTHKEVIAFFVPFTASLTFSYY